MNASTARGNRESWLSASENTGNLRAELIAAVLAARNADGGWPYYPRKTSRLEPTAWALLALSASGQEVTAEPLLGWPRQGPWWVDRSSNGVNIAFNALVGVALSGLGAAPQTTAPLLDALIEFKGEATRRGPEDKQNNSLQGWSWVAGTFSWLEPTAWAVIALKRLGRDRARERIEVGEQLLVDRVCHDGGWNYGNAWALDKQLPGHVPTTAIGLMALRDRSDLAVVGRALAFLEARRTAERAALSLGLTRMALSAHSRETGAVDDALAAQWRETKFIGNVHALALALYSISAGPQYSAFEIG